MIRKRRPPACGAKWERASPRPGLPSSRGLSSSNKGHKAEAGRSLIGREPRRAASSGGRSSYGGSRLRRMGASPRSVTRRVPADSVGGSGQNLHRGSEVGRFASSASETPNLSSGGSSHICPNEVSGPVVQRARGCQECRRRHSAGRGLAAGHVIEFPARRFWFRCSVFWISLFDARRNADRFAPTPSSTRQSGGTYALRPARRTLDISAT